MLTFALILATATVLSILFVDRPVAVFWAGHKHWRGVFQLCAAPSLLALPVAVVGLAVAVVRRLFGRPGLGRVWLATSIATLVGTTLKDELKWVFGRPWPTAWLKWHFYSFVPFTDNFYFGSFPSGHTAYISAPLCVLWVLVPRYRLVWGGVMGLVMFGLVAAGYHFVGDVLAGLLTGMLSAWGTLILIPARENA